MSVHLKDKYGSYAKYFVADALTRVENECEGFEPVMLKHVLDLIGQGKSANNSTEMEAYEQTNALLAIVCEFLEVATIDAELLESDKSLRNIFVAAFGFYSKEKVKMLLAPLSSPMVLRD